MIIYEGPSLLNPEHQIVVIATPDTTNKKTGQMVQVWYLLQDQAPHHATRTGLDQAICGNCPHRHHTGGACYIIPFQAPLAIWIAYMNGNYAHYTPGDLAGARIRFGAYGDPAAAPFDVMLPILDECDLDASTGYTHQLNHPNFDYRHTLYTQISVDTPRQAQRAHAQGLKTFRVAGDATKLLPGEVECLNTTQDITCAQCKLCNGQEQSIVITAHGTRSGSVKQHDVIARI